MSEAKAKTQGTVQTTGHAWDDCKLCADPGIECPGLDYRWHDGRSPWDVVTHDAPEWLLDLVVPARAEEPGAPGTVSSKSGSKYVARYSVNTPKLSKSM